MTAPSIRLMLRQLNKHQSCGALAFSHGSREADLTMIKQALITSMGEGVRVSCPKSERYPDPVATAEFVIDVPSELNIDQAARDLKFALLCHPDCAPALTARAALMESEKAPKARKPKGF